MHAGIKVLEMSPAQEAFCPYLSTIGSQSPSQF